jgi:hypothetical protein
MAKPVRRVRNAAKTRNKNMVETLEISNEQTSNIRHALAGWPMVLAWLAMIIFAFHSSTHMVGAGDTWVAMACGRHFLNNGVDTVEPFSANSHKSGPSASEIRKWPGWARSIAAKVSPETLKYWHPTGWVNQNWLTHVIFYWLTHESPIADSDEFPPSFNQLVYWKIAIYIISVICVYYVGRLLGANPALSAFFACFAMFVGRSFFDVRPAGFSNVLVAIYLLILVLATYRNILYIWLLVPVVTFWCNVHGGYIYAFIMLVPFVVLNFLTSFSKKWFVSIGLKGIYHTIGAGFVTFIATIIFNPFHLTNLTHTFVISFSKHAEMWRTVNEWHPAFEWKNPVGTSFPFLVLYILSIGLTLFWLFSRLLKPRFLKAAKYDLQEQKKLFTVLSRILGCAIAVLVCWIILISFSLLNFSAADFFICAAFVGIMLLSIYMNIHFVFLTIPLTLLALWAAKSAPGYNGRYIYPFILLPAYVTMHIFASLFSKDVKFKQTNIIFPVLASLATVLLMMLIFNPFGFKFPAWPMKTAEGFFPSISGWFRALLDWVISCLTRFLNFRRLTRPVYERNVEVNYTHMFAAFYMLSIISIIIWLMLPYLKKIFSQLPNKTEEEPPADTYRLPKIDLVMIAIAVLTTYMAIQSRRFIPIAAFAACPVVAMFIDQMVRTISAARNFHNNNQLAVSPMSQPLQLFFIVLGAAAVLISGMGWGLKFKRVYLDAWPTDSKLNSVFMRMTASDAKPFYACKFIRDNNIGGKVFNYWTEGGFIAYGQNPDPKTGKTPLQLFMDGRAQAAYEPTAYKMWSDIMSGGPAVYEAKVRQKAYDYKKIGTWVDKRLKDQKVWVVLMPTGQFETPFTKGLEYHPDWQVAFNNNKQKLFVDIKTEQGKKIHDGIFTGETLYPDEFSRNLIMAQKWFTIVQQTNAKTEAFKFAKKAFDLNQSQAPMRQIMFATRFPELRPEAEKFCRDYFEEFEKNVEIWPNEHGYHHRIAAALNACSFLREVAKSQNKPGEAQKYGEKMKLYQSKRQLLLKRKRW